MPETSDQSQGAGDPTTDRELTAIQVILGALTALDGEARKRVIGYVFERLGISLPQPRGHVSTPVPVVAAPSPVGSVAIESTTSRITDIRTLKEQKVPRSAVEMAAVLAYYLAELAPPNERKLEITPQDLSRYFKQAGFPLPGRPRQTLFAAKSAGYLDAGSDRGAYRLNPVGYNLVAHSLPTGESSNGGNTGSTVRRKASKPATARKAGPRKKRS